MDAKEQSLLRQQVVDWINSSRQFDKGLTLLLKTGYKPHVAVNIQKNSSRRDSPAKLLGELRLYLRYCVNPDSSVHDDENPFTDPDKAQETIDTELTVEYPDIVKKLLKECSDLYKARSISHKQLKEVGEKNDVPSINSRKWISLIIDASSRRMDDLWRHMQAYKADGTLPPEELFATPFDPELIAKQSLEPVQKKKVEKTGIPDDPEALKKLKENLRIKISKAENKLNFQTDKKQDKPNPMAEGPKRITQVKRIEDLKAQKLDVETKIANLK